MGRKFYLTLLAIVLLHGIATAHNNIDSVLNVLNKTGNDSVRVNCYNLIYKHYNYSNPDSAYYYLEQGLVYFRNKNYKYGIANLYHFLGSVDDDHGRTAIASKRQNEALRIFREIGNKSGEANTLNDLGIISGKKGNFDSATNLFLKALRIFKEINNNSGIANVYLSLGNISDNTEDYKKALEYYNKGLELVTDTQQVRTLCNFYNNIGILYGKKGDLKTSLAYFQKAMNRSNKEEYIDVYLYSLLNMGILHKMYGDSKKALDLYKNALQIATEKDMPEEQARLLLNIASITYETSNDQAIETLKDALGLAKKLGNKQILGETYEQLAENYKAKKDYKQLAEMLAEQRKIEDSLYNIEKVKEIANLESVYELEQSADKIKQLELTEQTNKLKRNILLLLSIGLVIILVFITVFYAKTRKMNMKLWKQKADLTAANATKDKLFSIIGHDLRGPVSNIPAILEMLHDNDVTAVDRDFVLTALKGQTQSISETLDTLLFWGKSHMKGNTLIQEPFDIAGSINNNIELLSINAGQKNISIINEAKTTVMVRGIKAHFDFIFRNLLSNAIKFTPEQGTVVISTNTALLPGFVVFGVKDNGIGIKKEKEKDIFEPVFSSASGTSGESGSGIGLMLCKEFVLENGGNIWFESEEGKGTVFYFSFKSA